MPLVTAAIAPHGWTVIPELDEDAEGYVETRVAMYELGKHFADARPDVIVIMGPHGVRVNGFISIADAARGAGTIFWEGNSVELNLQLDMELSTQIAERAQEAGLPVVGVGFGGSSPKGAVLPLDWGIITPLWFTGYGQNQPGMGHVLADPASGAEFRDDAPPVVIINMSKLIPREQNLAFGRIIAEIAEASEKRVALIASCDWSHTHKESGPYGFHPDAERMDATIVQAVKDNDLARLIDLDDEFVRNAAIDGLWQTLMLAGAMEIVPMDVSFRSYEAASYFGMLVALYTPRG